MMDFASTLAHTKGVAPTTSREEGGTEATAARPLRALPPPTTDRVDKMYYHQLAEIHAIAAAQLVESAHWCRSNPTPDTSHAYASWQGATAEPSTTRIALPPLTDFSPQASLW
jgi:hypothetical protein